MKVESRFIQDIKHSSVFAIKGTVKLFHNISQKDWQISFEKHFETSTMLYLRPRPLKILSGIHFYKKSREQIFWKLSFFDKINKAISEHLFLP